MGAHWDLLVFMAAFGVVAFTPGPGIAAVVASVLSQGARKTVWFCLGVVLADMVWLTLSLNGLSLIAQKIPFVFLVIKWAGAAYIAYLAWKTWNSSSALGDADGPKITERSNSARVLAGFAVTMGNPKAMLFYIALLPNLMTAEKLTVSVVLPYYLAVIAVLSVVFSVYIFAAEKARSAIRSPKAVRRFNRLTAGMLGGAAAWIVSS